MKNTLIFILLLYIYFTNLNIILCESERCQESQIHALKTYKRFLGRQASTFETCRDICHDDEDCEHFRFKVKCLTEDFAWTLFSEFRIKAAQNSVLAVILFAPSTNIQKNVFLTEWQESWETSLSVAEWRVQDTARLELRTPSLHQQVCPGGEKCFL